MNFNSTKISSFVLGVTALVLSSTVLHSFNDPEGPNLLIIGVFGAVIFGVSLVINYFHSGTLAVQGSTRLTVAIVVEIVFAGVMYFLFR